jgi:hypothetical protein
MIKLIITFCLCCFISYSQDTLELKLIWSKTGKGNLIGTIDEQQNIIVFDGSEIIKYDPNGDILFHQSIKSLGKLKEIDARNPFKILLFSENQQSINFCDNSLTLQNETIDLANFDLSNVICTSGSDQMDKCWIYSQDNSVLKLIGKNEQQFQSISNTKQLLNLQTIDQIKEVNSHLFLLDFTGKIVQFDMYGNLKSSFEFSPFKNVYIDNNLFYIQFGEQTIIYNYIKKINVGIINKSDNSTLIGKKGDFLYFLEGNKLSKFTIAN